MAGTIIIFIILIVAVYFGVKNIIRHGRGEGDCCGGGGGEVIGEVSDKELEGDIVATKVMHIEGMTCEKCVARVKRIINKIDGASAQVSLTEKRAVVQMTRDVSDLELRLAVENLGYQVTGIELQ